MHVVVDRTFVDEEGIRWIVDYKTAADRGGDAEAFLDREENRYRPQLDRYAQILRAWEDRPVRVGLYFPLIPAWRTWEPELEKEPDPSNRQASRRSNR